MPIARNDAKHKMLQGEMALGFQVYHLRSIATPLLAAASGYDFLFIDMEHGAFSMQEATQICIAALPTGVAPLVRVCTGALDEGTRLLDNGAMGIVVPHPRRDHGDRHRESPGPTACRQAGARFTSGLRLVATPPRSDCAVSLPTTAHC